MSLSPFDSFQSRFVTSLLNRPRILNTQVKKTVALTYKVFVRYFARRLTLYRSDDGVADGPKLVT